MRYTEWILEQFPELINEPTAKTFGLIDKAKEQAKLSMRLVGSACTLFAIVIAFIVASFSEEFTNIDFPIVLGVVYGLVYVVLGLIQKRVEQQIIKQKITELMRTKGI